MAEGQEQERTESATPKRREQAREAGQIVKSREVVSAGLFLGHVLFFFFAGATLFQKLWQVTHDVLATLGDVNISRDNISGVFMHYLWRITDILLPLFLVLFVLGVAMNVLQTGLLFSLKALEPKYGRLNPWQGLQQIFSLQSLNECVKAVIKIGIVGYIVYVSITAEMPQFFPLSQQAVADIIGYLGRSALRLGAQTAYALIALALLDYAFQRWQYEKNLRMTVQEIKEERKESEGDPQIRARIRSIMREMARRRMMEEVPKADVVVTNPTHLAVALRYRRHDMAAPKVVAKGAGYIAERIRAVAREHGVPLVENRVVAQSLYKTVQLGEVIPEALYKAVAEILAYVYRLKPRPAF
jgi:flagellar biosynthetic protein FlhB